MTAEQARIITEILEYKGYLGIDCIYRRIAEDAVWGKRSYSCNNLPDEMIKELRDNGYEVEVKGVNRKKIVTIKW